MVVAFLCSKNGVFHVAERMGFLALIYCQSWKKGIKRLRNNLVKSRMLSAKSGIATFTMIQDLLIEPGKAQRKGISYYFVRF